MDAGAQFQHARATPNFFCTALRQLTRTVALAKGARDFRTGLCKQATALRTGQRFLRLVRPEIAAPAVRPGLPLGHHPAAHVFTAVLQPSEAAPVVVALALGHGDVLPEHPARQRIALLGASKLANLGRVQPVKPQLAVAPT